MLPVEFDRLAVAEAKAAWRWYKRRSTATADRFLAELDSAVTRIAKAPRQWPSYFLETRVVRLRRFPYLVVYRERLEVVQVVAVTHGKAKPATGRSDYRDTMGLIEFPMSDLPQRNPTGRFTGLADKYAKYWPSYPAEAIEYIRSALCDYGRTRCWWTLAAGPASRHACFRHLASM